MWYLIKWIAFLVSAILLWWLDGIICVLTLIFFFRFSKEFEFKGKIKTGDIVPLMPYINPDQVQYQYQSQIQSVPQPDWVTVHYSQAYYKNYYDYFFRKEPKEIKKWTALTYVGKN